MIKRKNIKFIFHKNINFLAKVFSLFLVLVGFIFCFISGAFNSSSVFEKKADDIAQIVREHTVSGDNIAMIVQPKKESGKDMLEPGLELHNLYGTFGAKVANYGGFVNADKKHNICFNDAIYSDNMNLSFLYTITGFSFYKYKDTFLHQYYPLEVMFERDGSGKKSERLVCISETHANRILDGMGKEHSEDNYRSLLHLPIIFEMDGNDYTWTIENIYCERNYFYSAIKECVGEFVFGATGYPEGFNYQSVYFLSNYTFRNTFYFDYSLALYPQTDYDYMLGDNNIVDGYVIDQNLVNFDIRNNNALFILFFVLSVVFVLTSLAIVILFSLDCKYKFCIFYLLSALLPYLIFKFIYLLNKNMFLFSYFSTILNAIGIFTLFVVIVLIAQLRKTGVIKNGKGY